MINRVWILLIAVGLALPLSAQETTLFSRAAVVQTSLDMFTATSSDWLIPGAWNLTLYGGASIGDNAGEMFEAHVGIGHNLVEDLSINIELIGGYATMNDQGLDSGGEGGLTGFDLLFRWHLLKGEDWTFYLDGGAGLMYSDYAVPAKGTHFNFRPQFGFGASFSLGKSMRLIMGARWQHVSNLDKSGDDENPGYDAAFVYWGVLIPF